MYKKGAKIIASMLIFVMMFTYVSIIGEVIAVGGNNGTNNENVEFNAYFREGEEEKSAVIKNIGEQNYLYAKLTVKNAGYLKDTKISIENPNFKISETINDTNVAKVEKNTITINQIKYGNSVEIAIPIEFNETNLVSIEDICKANKVSLEATYVDSNGKDNKVTKDLNVTLGWSAVKNASFEVEVEKFIPYDINSTKGIILQMKAISLLENNTLPVKQEKIEISLPTINNIKPQSVKVIANSTNATNGDKEGIKFASENYVYDNTTNKLTITVNNMPDANGKIAWEKNAQDEFLITLIYPETAQIPETGEKITYEGSSQLTLMATKEDDAHATKSIKRERILKDPIGTIADIEETVTQKIAKGPIYANYKATNKVETKYNEEIEINVSVANLVDRIIVEKVRDNFIQTATENKSPIVNDMYYKSLKIEKANFDKMLGQEGYIKVYEAQTLIATIDKQTVANNNKLEIDLSQYNINEIKIETSKPIADGKLKINLEKALKKEFHLIDLYKSLEVNSKLIAENGSEKIVEKPITKTIELTEPETKAELVIEPESLSTVVTNNNVKIKAILDTDTIDCRLFKNPTLQIQLPKYIDEINIKNIELLFETEGTKLNLGSHQLIQNVDGTKTIVINLEGEQTEYSLGSVSKGLNVVITADIKVNKLTPNKQEDAIMTYTNNNRIFDNKQATAKMKFVAPTGIVTVTTVSNYKEGQEPVIAISGEQKQAILNIMSPERKAKLEMSLINNSTSSIEDVVILGRTLFKGNTNVNDGKDLKTTIDMPLTSLINISDVDINKVKVYYSENAKATKDLANAENGWTLTPSNIENVKSYLIVLENTTLNTGDGITFNYEIKVPENMQYNEYAYQDYVAYFKNNLPAGTINDKALATKVELTTGKGPVVEASISSNIEPNIELQQGDIVKYTLIVENTGTEIANNVIAKIKRAYGLSAIKKSDKTASGYETISANEDGEYEINIGNLEAGQKAQKEILMQANNIIEDKIEAQISGYVETQSIPNGKKETNIVKNTIVKTYFIVDESLLTIEEKRKVEFKENEEFIYKIKITSLTSEKVEDGKLELNIPSELEYKELIGGTAKYDKKTRKLIIPLEEVTNILKIKLKTNNLEENTYEKVAKITGTISGKDVRNQKVGQDIEILRPGLKVTQSATITENAIISAFEDFKYVFEIENLSKITLPDVQIIDMLPEEVILKEMKITVNGENPINSGEEDENGHPMESILLVGKKKAIVELSVSTTSLEQDTKISNYAVVKCEGLEDIKSNVISHTIKQYTLNKDPEAPVEKKRITGQVWEDKNNDGIKNDTEEKVADVEVRLFNNNTGEYVKDSQGNELKQKTGNDGTYSFTELEKGKYTVVFLYDTANYSATTYRKANVEDSKNSDGIDQKIVIDGVTRAAAITEEIELQDNVYNIDLGIVENKKFDLKLDKTVSKITVQDSEATNVYEYNDSKLAKKDIVGSKVEDTTIVVEYKIYVTNEGAIPGYVKKIVDYMPKEMKFSSELNRDWYTSTNGDIFNSSLSNTIINPGETKEVTLILSKKLSEDTLGLINNTAEIYEAYNDLGVEDTDSTVANKASEEDDISSADILITVKTGEWLAFTGLSILIITIIGVGAYFIKKKVLK